MLELIRAVHPAIETGFVLAVLWIVYRAVNGSWRFWQLAVGVDGRYSSSLFHGLAWTIVVLAAYVLLYLSRVHAGSTQALGEIPQNVLTALGLSLGTTVAAAGITSSHVARDPEAKTSASPLERTFGTLVSDDAGRPNLPKAQLMVWTLVSLAVYLVATADAAARTLAATDPSQLPGLPDIDTSLLVLSGIGQATYLATKVVAHPDPGSGADQAMAASGTAGTARAGAAGTRAMPDAGMALTSATVHAALTVPISVRVPASRRASTACISRTASPTSPTSASRSPASGRSRSATPAMACAAAWSTRSATCS